MLKWPSTRDWGLEGSLLHLVTCYAHCVVDQAPEKEYYVGRKKASYAALGRYMEALDPARAEQLRASFSRCLPGPVGSMAAPDTVDWGSAS